MVCVHCFTPRAEPHSVVLCSNGEGGSGPGVWLALNTFSRWWNLFPFTLEDFDQALSGGDCTLMREVYVTLLRTVVSQEREDALREQGRHRAKENDLGEFGASIVGGSEWLMHTDVSTLDARDDDWEDMLRQVRILSLNSNNHSI